MRINLPITEREHPIPEGARLISTTNAKGEIESANEAFIRISGFSAAELQGQPHNLVRHPDMPESVYRNFWDTLRRGKPWMGIVKNRCKNGDHYWVSAYVAPVFEHGRPVGYQSVRTRPSDIHKARAEKLYARLRAGKPLWSRWMPGLQTQVMLLALGAALLGLGSAGLAARLGAPLDLMLAGLVLAAAAMGARLVTRRLQRLSQTAQAVFDNDIGCAIYGDGHDVIAQAELAMTMQRAQRDALLGRVEDLIAELAHSSAETSTAAEESARVVTAQTQEIDQVVLATAQMNDGAQEISHTTATASTSTHAAADRARLGQETVARSTQAMHVLVDAVTQAATVMQTLREESRSIRHVLDVINDIASQTNLLALNAAIEAARAGDAGRGFAVVANEVRELAGRVSKSTDDINGMIERLESRATQAAAGMDHSTQTARHVAEEVEQANRVMADIQASMETIEAMNHEIAAVAEQQSQVATAISRRMADIDGGVQITRAAADRSRATSESLVKIVEALRSVLLQFRT